MHSLGAQASLAIKYLTVKHFLPLSISHLDFQRKHLVAFSNEFAIVAVERMLCSSRTHPAPHSTYETSQISERVDPSRTSRLMPCVGCTRNPTEYEAAAASCCQGKPRLEWNRRIVARSSCFAHPSAQFPFKHLRSQASPRHAQTTTRSSTCTSKKEIPRKDAYAFATLLANDDKKASVRNRQRRKWVVDLFR